MTRPQARSFAIVLIAAFGILPAVRLVGARAQSSGSLRPDVGAFVTEAQEKLAAGDAAALRALAASPDALSWYTAPAPGHSNAPKWRLAAMRAPAASGAMPEYLAVFYAFHTCESVGDHVHPLVATGSGWRIGTEIPETDTRGFRVRDHKLTVTYDLPHSACKISDDVSIERTGDSSGLCLLRLSSDMTVDRVSLGSETIPERHVPGLIALRPPADRTFTVSLAYYGTVNHPGTDYIRPSEAVLDSYWYPHIARLPARSTVTATAPKGWTVVAQGELVSKTETENGSTFTYRNEIPNCVFTLDAGPYAITTRQVGGRKLSAYLLKDSEQRANQCLDTLARAMAFYDKSFGPFPYTHYEVVETAGPFDGALEAYSFATFGPGTLPFTIPHELSHTWWGGIVPNPYTRSMWNESFANYSDSLFQRMSAAHRPPHALHGIHQDNERGRGLLQSFRVPIAQAFDTMNPAHSSVGYGKGSQVLDMLEDLIGTDSMIAAMRRFAADHPRGEPADWSEFEAAVRKTSGTDLSWFFDEWLDRGGVPVVRLANVTREQRNGKWVVRGDIVQEGEPYRLKLPIEVQGEGDQKAGALIDVREATTPFQIESTAPPSAVRLDPDGNVLLAGAKTDDGSDPFAVRFDR